MSNIKNVIKGINGLIVDTVMTENEGNSRYLNHHDLNIFEDWIKLLEKTNEDETNASVSLPNTTEIWNKAQSCSFMQFFKWLEELRS